MLTAGIDMEMVSTSYKNHLKTLVKNGNISMDMIDNAVRNIVKVKFKLGLFDAPYVNPKKFPELVNPKHLDIAQKTALQSIVLLKNENNILPLSKKIKNLAIIGPLADDPFEQLGTWTFDKNIEDSVTPLNAIRKHTGNNIKINY